MKRKAFGVTVFTVCLNANGGILLRDLRMPDFRDYAVDVPSPGVAGIGDTHVLGRFLRDIAKLNDEQHNFRVFGPDEALSNGLEALFDVTQRQWDAAAVPNGEFLAPAGRVMEMLSEHQCEGWLEGYLLTGRRGLFNCYEAFIHKALLQSASRNRAARRGAANTVL